MNLDELKDSIKNLTIWKKRGERAPHKPLLILYALGKIQQGKPRMLPYKQVRLDLKELLIEFGPLRKSYHPEQPFVRLANDGIWELDKKIQKKPNNMQLLLNDVNGGFTEEVYNLIVENFSQIPDIAQIVLDQHFPYTIHEDILNAVGLDFNLNIRKKRDPRFREKILRAYGYSCAICGFNVRLSHTLVGVEAAHIKWHQAGGPDIEENGLALCSMHHKLFDRGVFTINNENKMIVSQEAHGTHGFEEWLMRFHGSRIRKPIETGYEPNLEYVKWHIKEVFKGPERYLI